ncbi:MAG: hypothetical protein CMM95_00850 [Rickettsiales bacterium]|nr:hypothetical protein [Rickettsiales bacterium]|tara:strand:+ start:293 stop:583 length:291 start_codon:yes stop_codon:yes gene_type:complete
MKLVRFEKKEINQIMDVYSKKISIGEWKDYSISFKRNYAIFAIHKSFKIGPYFEIKKNNFKQSYFTLSFQNNVIVSSHKLNNVINYLKRPNLKLVR